MNLLKNHAIRIAAIAICVANCHLKAQALSYVATLLEPATITPSEAYGVSTTGQVGSGYKPKELNHALYWNGTAASVVDLNPTGYDRSSAFGISGDYQVGEGRIAGGSYRALLWNGTAASAVDLTPSWLSSSGATAIAGSQVVGYGLTLGTPTLNGRKHAILWDGFTAESAVDLNPDGFQTSEARGVYGNTQVGLAYELDANFPAHAFLWHGTAASGVDLTPTGFRSASASAVYENFQVGSGYRINQPSQPRALLWNGSAESYTDLSPPGTSGSSAFGVASTGIVGFAGNLTTIHAALWTFPSLEPVDLHPYLSTLGLPLTMSVARGIGENGVIVGWASTSTGRSYAVMWTPVPEPATCGTFAAAIFVTTLLRRRRV